MEQDVHNDTHKGRGGKKSSKNKKKKSTPRPYNLEILMYQALQNICGGYYKVIIVFNRVYQLYQSSMYNSVPNMKQLCKIFRL